MQMREISFTIDTKGGITSEIKGMTGQNCVHIAKKLKNGLGNVTDEKKQPEYYRDSRNVTGHIDSNFS